MIVTRPFALALGAALLLSGCASAPVRPLEINLVALNDFHGNLEPSKYTYTPPGSTQPRTIQAGGIDVLKGALDTFRKDDPDLLFVAAGDLVGASPAASSMFADEPSIEALNRMGLVASSLGNHEFDQGPKELLRQQHGGCDSPRPAKACRLSPDFKGAGFTYLAANVVDAQTGKTLVPGWRIVDVKGVKVGLIGAVLHDLASVTIASSINGLAIEDEAASINAVLPVMRAQGAQVFVVLIHEGGFADQPYDKADCDTLHGPIVAITKQLDPAIRLVISGHSHTGYLCKVDGKVVTQADAYGHLLSRIRLTLDPATKAVQDIQVRNVVMAPDAFQPDASLSAYLADVRAKSRAALAKPVARVQGALSRKENPAGESVLGGVIADAAVAATRDQGAQVGFMNPGGIRKDLETGEGGIVSFGQAQAVLPFGNTLVVMDLTGAQLRRVLEQQWDRPAASSPSVLAVSSSLTYDWDGTQPAGRRTANVKVDGKALDDNKVYRVVANNFLAEGGDNIPMFAKGTRRVETGLRDLDALIAYLQKHPEAGGMSLTAPQRIRKVR
ncbi:multifunctional 2',3'-cyclic-nucleotide 2'-phosphodiesterase/5'-nucleotidase/3'-nucleotidase [Massilia sp. Root133]|uniref:bifunctional metallophosphatase/5'-nucleotidase n=1 Tax=unclassified Massilia TaxID=2609279 RepID=UPI0006FEDC3F|nr:MULTISPECIES: bifunctional metallophosphatase/5'-nucleotidase [unclassified Massilia]KQY18872.1 multifunctional 2',3'-cyclic-nucleotide 2'-phosphodiesterase/5'-nucleotidase/3'-nucleotidase [Massilia sp. Root133]KQZ53575.1 multifunctional 2',3'-cyclic-nucleotide 2'-phosphodiesterase/5'-nucleotidase/3'-nucleotidase [Massilia sp. Root1485]